MPAVTTDLGTKLGTRLSNGVEIHHCKYGLLPLVAALLSSRATRSFASWPAPRVQSFRGLLKLHTRYGLPGCSPTIRGLYREAPPLPVSRLERSQAIKSYQQLLEWVLPPLVIYALGAHCESRVSIDVM